MHAATVWQIVCVALLVPALFAVWSTHRRARAERALSVRADNVLAQLDALRSQLARATEQRDRLYWLEWWIRNACETPSSDPARPLLIRYAIAAHLAPDWTTLHRDLHRVALDANRSERERTYAAAFVSEMELAERAQTPWVMFAAQPAQQGRPLHNAEALAASYRAALDSWDALLGPTFDRGHAPDDRPRSPAAS